MSSNEFRKRIVKKHSKRGASTNAATRDIISFLNYSGFKVWRNNTTGIFDPKAAAKKLLQLIKSCWNHHRIPNIKEVEKILYSSFRKNAGENGIADIIGYHKETGRFIAVEVKTGKDCLAIHQKRFLNDVNRGRGIAMVASCAGDVVEELEARGYM